MKTLPSALRICKLPELWVVMVRVPLVVFITPPTVTPPVVTVHRLNFRPRKMISVKMGPAILFVYFIF
jgi:hypothetical protein